MQHLDVRMASANSLQTATRVHLDDITSADEALLNLDIFYFIVLHLLSVGGIHAVSVMDLLHIIERLEDIQTEVQGMITLPNLTMVLLYDISRGWSTYLNICVTSSLFDDVG